MGDEELIGVFNEKYRDEKLGASEERLRKIAEVCRKVHGDEFAEKCLERIKTNGYINRAQHYFGLHYRADEMPEGNEKYLRLMQECGFGWFREYRPTSATAQDR